MWLLGRGQLLDFSGGLVHMWRLSLASFFPQNYLSSYFKSDLLIKHLFRYLLNKTKAIKCNAERDNSALFLISSNPDGCIKWLFKLLPQDVNSGEKKSHVKSLCLPYFPSSLFFPYFNSKAFRYQLLFFFWSGMWLTWDVEKFCLKLYLRKYKIIWNFNKNWWWKESGLFVQMGLEWKYLIYM